MFHTLRVRGRNRRLELVHRATLQRRRQRVFRALFARQRQQQRARLDARRVRAGAGCVCVVCGVCVCGAWRGAGSVREGTRWGGKGREERGERERVIIKSGENKWSLNMRFSLDN